MLVGFRVCIEDLKDLIGNGESPSLDELPLVVALEVVFDHIGVKLKLDGDVVELPILEPSLDRDVLLCLDLVHVGQGLHLLRVQLHVLRVLDDRLELVVTHQEFILVLDDPFLVVLFALVHPGIVVEMSFVLVEVGAIRGIEVLDLLAVSVVVIGVHDSVHHVVVPAILG